MEPLPPNRCPACAAVLPVSEGPDLVCPECGKELRFARSLLEPVLYRTWTAWALSALEQHLRWEAVTPAWREYRERWSRALRASEAAAETAARLLELEGCTQWSAVQPSWATRREAWAAPLKVRIREPQLAIALLRFEEALTWEAVSPDWRAYVERWREKLDAIARAD